MDEKQAAALSKVVAKACKWHDSRQAKAGTTGKQKDRAQSRHREDGNELSEAVEKYKECER